MGGATGDFVGAIVGLPVGEAVGDLKTHPATKLPP